MRYRGPLPHIKGVWAQHRKRIELEPWQCFIVSVVFGWMCRATDTRRFRVAYIEVPRKTAKSTLTSATGLYLLACDGEHGAYVVSAANTRDQAKLVFTDAQQMAKREAGFRTRFGVEVLAHTIIQQDTASKFEALSAEYSNLDGLNVHAALIAHGGRARNFWGCAEGLYRDETMALLSSLGLAGLTNAVSGELSHGVQKQLELTLLSAEAARRELPSTIAVDVVEREAACVVALNALYLADTRGLVFKRANPDEAAALPVITGVDRDAYLSEPEHAREHVREALEDILRLGSANIPDLWFTAEQLAASRMTDS